MNQRLGLSCQSVVTELAARVKLRTIQALDSYSFLILREEPGDDGSHVETGRTEEFSSRVRVSAMILQVAPNCGSRCVLKVVSSSL